MSKPTERGVLKTPPEEEMAIMCEKGMTDRVVELLEFGVDPNHYGEERSYLHIAVRNGHSTIAGKLIRAGAHVQRTHLTASIRGGNPYCAEKVLDEFFYAGTEIDLPHIGHELMLARGEAAASTPKMLRWLAKNGVPFAEPDRLGRTVLEVAQVDGASPEILEVLEELSA
jgi:hypothetical protein